MPNVKLYSTSTCHYCAMAKEFLKKNNIQYENLDVGMNREAGKEMVNKSGQMGVPVLDIDGEIIVGFDKDAISKALDLT
ncbi:MAG: glutaredoxin domain-containing protein [Candidatus Omnitrophota bacterium]|nr:glutaredoxin domain-containing protein [Candidatus Omnitrophota bacterium]